MTLTRLSKRKSHEIHEPEAGTEVPNPEDNPSCNFQLPPLHYEQY